jgi:apolipoprotein N-acyltransferase
MFPAAKGTPARTGVPASHSRSEHTSSRSGRSARFRWTRGLLSGVILGLLSGLLLDLPFPLAGPLPSWRAVVSLFALVPLLYAILRPQAVEGPRYLWRSAAAGYACGVLWYALNCYWIYATMHIYGALPPVVSAGILVLYSLILGLYFALFAWLIAISRLAARRVLPALAMAPVLWVAIEYLAAHFTEVPWDQLGYSQVDNVVLTQLAPVTGVYGISLVIVGTNAVLMGVFFAPTPRRRMRFLAGGLVLVCALQLGSYLHPEAAPREAKALLLQENLEVGYNLQDNNNWMDLPGDPSWTRHTGQFLRLSEDTCTPYLLGMPEPNPRTVQRFCPGLPPTVTLVAWPEAPSPFRASDPRFQTLMSDLSAGTGATTVVGAPYFDMNGEAFNSALIFRPDASSEGRYDKIHLVPWGEYVPFKQFFAFAGNLTGNVASFTHGRERKVFALPDGHRFSVFICYEAVFASEIREFAKNGAQVFVNISDDGWYGDTSAPWQHLNMARMRAIENRRWILRDTNSGVTASIDPLGRVTESVPRHELTALTADYGYRSDVTFYTRYGDVFAWLCGIIALAWTGFCLAKLYVPRQVPSDVERS